LIGERVAKVTVQDRQEIAHQLLEQRSVEAIVRPHLGVIGLIATITSQDVDRIARRQVDQDEGEHQHCEDQRHRLSQAPGGISYK